MPIAFYDTRLRVDDVSALAHLYPVTPSNLAQWPGKTLTDEGSGSISGRVLFADGSGMPGVNVVARWIDPVTGQRSRSIAVSCVSGFLHSGRLGNPITGFMNLSGIRFDAFGSAEPGLAGRFEITGLPLPNGANTQYEVSVEPVNPVYTEDYSVGPYEVAQVTPSGTFAPLTVKVSGGTSSSVDLVMSKSAADPGNNLSSFSTTLAVPRAGFWVSTLAGGRTTDFLSFHARANRSFTIDIAALDENRRPTQAKLIPAVGVWDQVDTAPVAPDVVASDFSSGIPGVTRINATTTADNLIRVGIADVRGEARSDFLYNGRLLYVDSVEASRSGANLLLHITGSGFTNAVWVALGSARAIVTASSSTLIVANVPQPADGIYDVTLTDAVTGATSTAFASMQVGDAAATIRLASQPITSALPLGSVTPTPLIFRVVDSLGHPISGERVQLQTSGNNTMSACGAAVCIVQTNDAGEVATGIVLQSTGVITITATLGSGSTAATTLQSVSASTAIVALTPQVWVASGSPAANVPLTLQVLRSWGPASQVSVTFSGNGAAVPATQKTDANGIIRFSVTPSSAAPNSQSSVNACITAAPATCAQFTLNSVDSSSERLRTLQGTAQIVTPGYTPAPVIFQVTDGSGNPVSNATFTCVLSLFRPASVASGSQSSEVQTSSSVSPELIRSETQTLTTALDGTATASIRPEYLLSNLDLQFAATLPNGQSQWVQMRIRNTP
ncbi:MAG: hypothetical protein NVS9B15_11510 [Acidobacteriaceae bacterium]